MFQNFWFQSLILSGPILLSKLSLSLFAGADAATQTPCCMVHRGWAQNHLLEWTQCLCLISHHLQRHGVNMGPCPFSLQWPPLLSAQSGLGDRDLSLPLLYCWPCLRGLAGGGVVSFCISCCL